MRMLFFGCIHVQMSFSNMVPSHDPIFKILIKSFGHMNSFIKVTNYFVGSIDELWRSHGFLFISEKHERLVWVHILLEKMIFNP